MSDATTVSPTEEEAYEPGPSESSARDEQAATPAESGTRGLRLAGEAPENLSSIETARSVANRSAYKEAWDENMTIDGRIVDVADSTVSIDCLVDREGSVFEERVFDRALLDGEIPKVEEGRYVVLRIKYRPGVFLLTISNGEKMVDRTPFESEPNLEELEGFDFGQPYEEPEDL